MLMQPFFNETSSLPFSAILSEIPCGDVHRQMKCVIVQIPKNQTSHTCETAIMSSV